MAFRIILSLVPLSVSRQALHPVSVTAIGPELAPLLWGP